MELIQQSQCYIQVSYNASLSGLGGRVGSLQQGPSTAQPQALPRVPSCLLRSFTLPPTPQIRTASGLTQRFSKLLPGLCHLSATYRAETPVLRAKASSSGRGRGRGSGDASATVLSPVGRMYSKGSLQSFQNVNFTSTVLQKHDISRFNSWRFVILQRWGPERGRACL